MKRRRGVVLADAILQAAADELVESGYAGLTMEAVARRAGTNKNAVYRRWPGKAALGIAAYGRLADAATDVPDTGSLREDVLELLRRVNRQFSSPLGAVQRDLLAAAAAEADLLAGLRAASADAGSRLWLGVLERAVTRGEAPASALHPRVATVAVVLLRNEYVVRGAQTAPDDVLVEIVDEVYLPLVRGRAALHASADPADDRGRDEEDRPDHEQPEQALDRQADDRQHQPHHQ
ncbi:TetR/AcrR family transcriptional regulator [Micromonospora sp. PLK6-60]|uniref:TetR/AcrR family transcriptional regulator n=1 Tax=Micromonospora sp. PLK6-60 TaxID=2873383 RepID=UPI0027E03C41|nr:TetR/AcrR family transcriptional regulator [Micromonospora sp. PLK6-60]